ncbi:dTDP-4-dehydrorhamnose reductase [Kosakonia cowanii]
MNVLLFGKNGQLGWELQRALAPLGNLVTLDRRSIEYCGDLSRPQDIADTIRRIRPQVIVNSAAYTAVDKAESERELAYTINALSVEAMAREAANLDACVVHYSSDYVFPGSGEVAWQENDETAPLNFYGETKLAGEKALQQYCPNHMIFRTSWVYASRGQNFAKTMLRLGKERKSLGVINDQFGAPTGAELLADCTAHAIRTAIQHSNVAGIYHLSATGAVSWYKYAELIFDEARKAGITLSLESLNSISSKDYPVPAKRPLNSRLDTRKFQDTFGLVLPRWETGVRRMLNEVFSAGMFGL